MRKLLNNKLAASLTVTIACISTAHAAADVDALGKSDGQNYGVIGLAPVVSFNCVGVNAGIWMIDTFTNYLGTIAVSANSNAASALTAILQTSISLASSSYSRPEAGVCRLSGLINPTVTDYLLTLSSHQDIAFVPGNSSNVMNVVAQKLPATVGSFGSGLWGTFTLASATPNLELDGSLVWRLGMVVSVNGFRTNGFNTFYRGGYITQAATTATVTAASAVTSTPP